MMEKKADAHARKEDAPAVKKAVPKEKEYISSNPNFKGIVRIAGKDVKGQRKLGRALLHVRGIGNTMGKALANVIQGELGINSDKLVGDLTDHEIENIDKILFSSQDHKLPSFLFNRRKDYIEGSDRHYIMNDLLFSTKQDLERSKKLFTWIGYRHSYGQKVRGQRTRNTGRSGMAVGVLRKAVLAAQKGGAGSEAKGAAGAPAAAGAKAPAAGAVATAPAAKATEKPKPATPQGK